MSAVTSQTRATGAGEAPQPTPPRAHGHGPRIARIFSSVSLSHSRLERIHSRGSSSIRVCLTVTRKQMPGSHQSQSLDLLRLVSEPPEPSPSGTGATIPCRSLSVCASASSTSARVRTLLEAVARRADCTGQLVARTGTASAGTLMTRGCSNKGISVAISCRSLCHAANCRSSLSWCVIVMFCWSGLRIHFRA